MFAYLRYVACLALAATIPGLSNAQTTLQVYEPFSYSAGALLNGQNGGTGFNSSGATWVDDSLTAKVSTSGLNYGSGVNTLSTSGLATTLQSSGFSVATRNMTTPPVAASNTFWLSFLIQRNNNTSTSSFSANEYAGISIGGDPTVAGTRTFIGAATVAGGSSNQDIRYTIGTNGQSGTDVNTSTDAVATTSTNNVALIVTKVTLNGDVGATFDVYVNPTTLGTGTGPATPSYSYTNNTFVNFLKIGLEYGMGADYTVDELRIGQTFIDVTPVPEPTTMVALSIMAIGGGAWLRKKKLPASEGQPILAV